MLVSKKNICISFLILINRGGFETGEESCYSGLVKSYTGIQCQVCRSGFYKNTITKTCDVCKESDFGNFLIVLFILIYLMINMISVS